MWSAKRFGIALAGTSLVLALFACGGGGDQPNAAALKETQTALEATQAALNSGGGGNVEAPTSAPAGSEEGNGAASLPGFDALLSKMTEYNSAGQELRNVHLNPDGSWVLLSGANGYDSEGLPQRLLTALDQINADRYSIAQVAFGYDGTWVVLYGDTGYVTSGGMPDSALAKLKEINGVGGTFRSFAFSPNGGWVVFYGRNEIWWDGIPQRAANDLNDLYNQNQIVTAIAFTPDGGGWVILYGGGGYVAKNIPDDLATELQRLNRDGENIKQVVFTSPTGWIVLYGGNGFSTP